MTSTTPAGSNAAAEVVVVGSVNRDYVCRVDRLPMPGQTMLGGEASVGSGGKGGNQAVAASLLGARTAMIAHIGHDDDGRALTAGLRSAGVDVSEVTALDGVRTGMAFVFVDVAGENSIVVAPGANGRLTGSETAPALRRKLAPPGVLVVQGEVPSEAVVAAISTAAELGCRSVVNLAPYQPLRSDVLALCDPLVVNESEAGDLLGIDIADIAAAERAVAELAQRTRSAVITLGVAGAVLAESAATRSVAAEQVHVVDTTGAGDAFTGAVAAALSKGADLVDAVRLGVRAGTFAVSRPGAQGSYPLREELGLDDPSAGFG